MTEQVIRARELREYDRHSSTRANTQRRFLQRSENRFLPDDDLYEASKENKADHNADPVPEQTLNHGVEPLHPSRDRRRPQGVSHKPPCIFAIGNRSFNVYDPPRPRECRSSKAVDLDATEWRPS